MQSEHLQQLTCHMRLILGGMVVRCIMLYHDPWIHGQCLRRYFTLEVIVIILHPSPISQQKIQMESIRDSPVSPQSSALLQDAMDTRGLCSYGPTNSYNWDYIDI